MWKSGLFCFLLLASSFGVNAADYTPRWSVSGIDSLAELWLDLDVGTFSIAAHGLIRSENDQAALVAGSCLVTSEGGVGCMIVAIKGFTFRISIDDYLNGTITAYSPLGSEQQTGTMTFLGL